MNDRQELRQGPQRVWFLSCEGCQYLEPVGMWGVVYYCKAPEAWGTLPLQGLVVSMREIGRKSTTPDWCPYPLREEGQ